MKTNRDTIVCVRHSQQAVGLGGDEMAQADDYLICEVTSSTAATCTDRQPVSRCAVRQLHDSLFCCCRMSTRLHIYFSKPLRRGCQDLDISSAATVLAAWFWWIARCWCWFRPPDVNQLRILVVVRPMHVCNLLHVCFECNGTVWYALCSKPSVIQQCKPNNSSIWYIILLNRLCKLYVFFPSFF